MVFYRDILSRRHRAAALGGGPGDRRPRCSPSRCPAPGSPGFMRKAAQIAKAGIYDLRVHRDEVLLPILRALAHLRADRPRRRRGGRARDARPASRRARGERRAVRIEARRGRRPAAVARRLTRSEGPASPSGATPRYPCRACPSPRTIPLPRRRRPRALPVGPASSRCPTTTTRSSRPRLSRPSSTAPRPVAAARPRPPGRPPSPARSCRPTRTGRTSCAARRPARRATAGRPRSSSSSSPSIPSDARPEARRRLLDVLGREARETDRAAANGPGRFLLLLPGDRRDEAGHVADRIERGYRGSDPRAPGRARHPHRDRGGRGAAPTRSPRSTTPQRRLDGIVDEDDELEDAS